MWLLFFKKTEKETAALIQYSITTRGVFMGGGSGGSGGGADIEHEEVMALKTGKADDNQMPAKILPNTDTKWLPLPYTLLPNERVASYA